MVINGPSYTGGAGIIDLVTFGSRSGSFTDPANISISGFDPLRYENLLVSYDDDGMFLQYDHIVPEPSPVILLGLGGMLLYPARRRKTAA